MEQSEYRTSMPEKFSEIIPEVRNLLEMYEFYLVERNLKKPIEQLTEIVRDLRIIIQRLLNFYLDLSTSDEELFAKALAYDLTEKGKSLTPDEEYIMYFVEQTLVPFEWATEIKSAYADSLEMQKMLAADIPILRPFDYGFQGQMKVLHAKIPYKK